MSIILSNGYRETAEVEFSGKHPDIFMTYAMARLVKNLAEKTHEIDSNGSGLLGRFRADLNGQLGTVRHEPGKVTPIRLSIAGQLVIPDGVDFEGIAYQTLEEQLRESGYLDTGNFSLDNAIIDHSRITPQAININATSNGNKFADSAIAYGHYIRPPHGIHGTFPSLEVAKKIDETLDNLVRLKKNELMPDGKVHVTVEHRKDGFDVVDVYLSVAHAPGLNSDYRETIKKHIIANLPEYRLGRAHWHINEGGFDQYFIQADSGVSKAKDPEIITGGLHQLGTDKVWGKCMYKASSVIIPYAFALSRAVAEETGAGFASVRVSSKYGQKEADIEIADLDFFLGDDRPCISDALQHMPRDRKQILGLLGMDTGIAAYRQFNDVAGFHGNDKPWKQHNAGLRALFHKHLSNAISDNE